jgi:hypothetical protein
MSVLELKMSLSLLKMREQRTAEVIARHRVFRA